MSVSRNSTPRSTSGTDDCRVASLSGGSTYGLLLSLLLSGRFLLFRFCCLPRIPIVRVKELLQIVGLHLLGEAIAGHDRRINPCDTVGRLNGTTFQHSWNGKSSARSPPKRLSHGCKRDTQSLVRDVRENVAAEGVTHRPAICEPSGVHLRGGTDFSIAMIKESAKVYDGGSQQVCLFNTEV